MSSYIKPQSTVQTIILQYSDWYTDRCWVGWAATFGRPTARRGLGGAPAASPVSSSLYQMQQPTHQRSL